MRPFIIDSLKKPTHQLVSASPMLRAQVRPLNLNHARSGLHSSLNCWSIGAMAYSRSRLPKSPSDENPKQSTVVTPNTRSVLEHSFWACRHTWKRARINTLRCLVGCTVGDLSTFWALQTFLPEMGMGPMMALSSKISPSHNLNLATESVRIAVTAGISTSILLETVLLKRGRDQLSWPLAARTAMGMSLVSMLAMEVAENLVDFQLTGGVVAFHEPQFWVAAVVSIGAGYLVPLPYNYLRLRKYGKACH